MEQGRWQWDAFDHREEALATRPSVAADVPEVRSGNAAVNRRPLLDTYAIRWQHMTSIDAIGSPADGMKWPRAIMDPTT